MMSPWTYIARHLSGKEFGDLRGRLGKSRIMYTAGMVAEELKERGKYGDRGACYKRWLKRATLDVLR